MTFDNPSITDIELEGFAAACAAGSWFAQRTRHRELQIRRTFVQGRDAKPGPPPLATLMRGGRGGEVRLKLLLSLLWVGAKAPHDVTFPARSWAELVGLPDVATKGARRVREATDWLVLHHFLVAELRPGLPNVLTLRREDGSGVPYEVPGSAAVRARSRGRGLDAHRYVRLPHGLWSNGWMAVLSAPALAAVLLLLAEQRGPNIETVWLSPRAARDRYALSDQTRYKGLAELEAVGLVERQTMRLSPGPYDVQRTRNAYTLRLERLEAKPSMNSWAPSSKIVRGSLPPEAENLRAESR